MDRLNNKVNLASVDTFMNLYLDTNEFEQMTNLLRVE
jgi:small nuclear ribonucleoprotein (snRNP)-like protein